MEKKSLVIGIMIGIATAFVLPIIMIVLNYNISSDLLAKVLMGESPTGGMAKTIIYLGYYRAFQYIIGAILIYQLIYFRYSSSSTFRRGTYLWLVSCLTCGEIVSGKSIMWFFDSSNLLKNMVPQVLSWLIYFVAAQIIAFVSDKLNKMLKKK
jgi:hypothetical protein